MSRARDLSRLSNPTNFTPDATTGRVGLGSENPTAKLNVAGIVSATAFYGDGSNLEGVASAGLGTALGENNPLDVIYYTNNILNVNDNTTITVPTGSDTAYTQYAEVVVADSKDLIIADGDNFIPDVLGISTEGIASISGTGGRVRADFYTNHAGTGAPTFQTGVVVTGVATATSFSGATGTFTGDVDIADKIIHTGDTNTAIRFPAADTFTVETGGSERLRADSSGRLLVGGGSTTTTCTALFQGRSDGATNSANLRLSKGSYTPGTTDSLGIISFGDKGIQPAAQIQVSRDSGTWSTNSRTPGAMLFMTAPDSASAATERLRIDSSGKVGININNPGSYNSAGNELVLGNTGNNGGMTIVSGTGNNGHIFFADGTGTPNQGIIKYEHANDAMAFNINTRERMRIGFTTASVASTGDGVNGSGVLGINESDPAGDALALTVLAPYGMEDPRPLVYMRRSHGIGGGSATDETVLHLDGTASYNSAGVVYGIKVNTKHNLNGSHYSGHFVNDGSQYSANDTSAVYVETHKKDTNGAGAVMALHANGRITTGSGNSGYAIAGFFQTGNNINGRPIVCLQEYTANTYTHQIEFRKNNGSSNVTVGSIKSNNTNTQYNTSSDYRLKENVVSLTGAIDRLKQLQPKRFNFIGDGETIDGFIAHEVSSTAPYAVSGEKDAVKIELVMGEDGKEQFDEDGEIISREVIDPQGVDYGKLSALTIAALQEALAKIETLETEVAALKAG
jgi:hypothetical protein